MGAQEAQDQFPGSQGDAITLDSYERKLLAVYLGGIGVWTLLFLTNSVTLYILLYLGMAIMVMGFYSLEPVEDAMPLVPRSKRKGV